MGSAKHLETIRTPQNNSTGLGQFTFSDCYSVFDWGEMPDVIKNKGASLCLIGAYFFEKLKSLGIKNHYIDLKHKYGPLTLDSIKEPPESMLIELFNVIMPEKKSNSYDYTAYKNLKNNFLIPLEIIYRNSLPAGSSIIKRLEAGTLKLKDIGLDKMPVPGQVLKRPLIDVSTKLESIDRYISWEEAQEISGLFDKEIEELKELTLIINSLISSEVSKFGIFNEDGKLEFGMDENRNIILVDVIGTPDECRFTYNNIPLSIEIARIYYRNTSWYEEICMAKERDSVNWKNYFNSNPLQLPEELSGYISAVYQTLCNEITGREWFDVGTFQEIYFR